MGVKVDLGEIVPSTAMVMVEGCTIGLTTLASTAMSKGMSPFVFVVYTNAIGSVILLPYSFLYDRNTEMPLLTFSFLVRVFFLGLVGVTVAQNLAFVGLSYSSPIVAIAMANIIPAISFLLAIILRTTKFKWGSSGSQARLIGTLISIIGATLVTLYRGPTVRNHSSPSLSLQSAAASPPHHHLFVFLSTHENWVLGCSLFAASSLALSIWNLMQVGTVKIYPQVMKITSFYSLFGTIQSAVLAAFIERDLSAWRLELNLELFVIIITAIFSSWIRSNVQIWCMRTKGPYFVPIFKPFGILFASAFGCLLFADTFHYGSMMGAFVCGAGYYTVTWGQIKEEDDEMQKTVRSSSDDKVPLLQEEDSQV